MVDSDCGGGRGVPRPYRLWRKSGGTIPEGLDVCRQVCSGGLGRREKPAPQPLGLCIPLGMRPPQLCNYSIRVNFSPWAWGRGSDMLLTVGGSAGSTR